MAYLIPDSTQASRMRVVQGTTVTLDLVMSNTGSAPVTPWYWLEVMIGTEIIEWWRGEFVSIPVGFTGRLKASFVDNRELGWRDVRFLITRAESMEGRLHEVTWNSAYEVVP